MKLALVALHLTIGGLCASGLVLATNFDGRDNLDRHIFTRNTTLKSKGSTSDEAIHRTNAFDDWFINPATNSVMSVTNPGSFQGIGRPIILDSCAKDTPQTNETYYQMGYYVYSYQTPVNLTESLPHNRIIYSEPIYQVKYNIDNNDNNESAQIEPLFQSSPLPHVPKQKGKASKSKYKPSSCKHLTDEDKTILRRLLIQYPDARGKKLSELARNLGIRLNRGAAQSFIKSNELKKKTSYGYLSNKDIEVLEMLVSDNPEIIGAELSRLAKTKDIIINTKAARSLINNTIQKNKNRLKPIGSSINLHQKPTPFMGTFEQNGSILMPVNITQPKVMLSGSVRRSPNDLSKYMPESAKRR